MKAIISIILLFLCSLSFGQLVAYEPGSRANGVFEQHDKSGQLQIRYTKVKNELSGPVEFYDDGKLIQKGWFVQNKRHSKWIAYHENGRKKAEVQFITGKRHGVWRIWDEDGNLRYRYSFRNGRPSGEWVMLDEHGETIQHRSY